MNEKVFDIIIAVVTILVIVGWLYFATNYIIPYVTSPPTVSF